MKCIGLVGIIYISGLVSCANMTRIHVVDKSGAIDTEVAIYVDGLSKGSGEAFHSDNNIFRPGKVMLKKDKCQVVRQTLHFKINIAKAILGSTLAGLAGHFLISKSPLLWATGPLIAIPTYIISPVFFAAMLGREYKDLYTYHFRCTPL